MTIETIEKYLKKNGIKYVRNFAIPEKPIKKSTNKPKKNR